MLVESASVEAIKELVLATFVLAEDSDVFKNSLNYVPNLSKEQILSYLRYLCEVVVAHRIFTKEVELNHILLFFSIQHVFIVKLNKLLVLQNILRTTLFAVITISCCPLVELER